MKKSKYNNFTNALLFIGILLFILSALGKLFYPSDTISDPSMKSFEARKIFAEEDNTIDVVVLGHSRVYAGLSPMEIYDECGVTAYACSEPLQTPWQAYYLLKDVYKTQSPKLILYEVDQVFYNDTTKNINSAVSSIFTRAFPIIEFHNNWKKIGNISNSKEKNQRRATKGYRFFEGVKGIDNYPLPETNNCEKMSKLSKSYLNKIVELTKNNQSQIMFFAMPARSSWDMARHNSIKEFANTYAINFLDLNSFDIENQIGLDWRYDTRDYGDHLNHLGAVKVSRFLAAYLVSQFDLPDHRSDPSYAHWQNDLESYKNTTQRTEVKNNAI